MAERFKAFKKVYATVTSEVYSKFRKRAFREGLDMNDALAGLVTTWANGGAIVINKKQRESAQKDWSYQKEKEKENDG